MGTWTPWGTSDSSQKVVRGIVFYTTPRHGGFHLSPTMNDKVHPAWRRRDGWYEEDLDWAIVVLTFPDLFHSSKVSDARTIAQDWRPHEYMKITGEKLELKDSYMLRKEDAERRLADKWVAVSAFGDWHHAVPKGKVGVLATKGAKRGMWNQPKPEEKWFLVDAGRYDDKDLRSPIGYVIDETTDTPIDPLQ